jgi:hypothetical protein
LQRDWRIELNRTPADLGIHDNETPLTVAEREATIRDLLISERAGGEPAEPECPQARGCKGRLAPSR